MRRCHDPLAIDQGTTTGVIRDSLVRLSKGDLPWPGMRKGYNATNDTRSESGTVAATLRVKSIKICIIEIYS